METNTIAMIVSAVAALPIFMSGTMKLIKHPVVVKNLTQYGFKESVLKPFGVIEYALVGMYFYTPTSFIATILITGWMGGAIATHLRAGDKFIVQTLIPILIWVGFGLRNEAPIRQLLGL